MNQEKLYLSIVRKIPIDKGWSGDQKYCAVTEFGEKMLLRIAPLARLERKQREFSNMQKVAALGIPMCLPLEMGICDEGVYTLHSWVDGMDAEDWISGQSSKTQYAYGLEAGRILRKIHSIPAPEDVHPWESYFNAKIDRKIAAYEACPLRYDGGESLLTYLRENRHYLANRPQTYQHGDYHIGNMMIGPNGTLIIIDFDKDDFGDPWEEFNRIVWSAQAAPMFAKGIVDGYFDGNVPMEFWHLLALYICSNSLGSLPWAIPFGEGEIQVMRHQAAEILEWYDGMNNVIPTWYRTK